MSEFLQVISAAKTDTGRKRKNNEDYVLYFEPGNLNQIQANGNLYIVADGVGGEARGEYASKFSAHKVLYEYYSQHGVPIVERLFSAMNKADQEIKAYVQKYNLTRMATTMVAAVVQGNKLTIANVGDSRAYLFRNNQLTQITQDHNLVGEMIKSGILTEEEALTSDVKNRLLRSIGGHSEMKPEFFEEYLQVGDRIMLCSDGFTRYATPELVLRMATEGSPQQVVEQLVEYACQQGGADNITTIVVDVVGPLDTSRTQYPRGAPPEPVTLHELMGKVVGQAVPEEPYPGQEVLETRADTTPVPSSAETMPAHPTVDLSTAGRTVEIPPVSPADATMQVHPPAMFEKAGTTGAVQPMQRQFADPATIQWSSRSEQAEKTTKDFPVWIIPVAIIGGVILIVMVFIGWRIISNMLNKAEPTLTPTTAEEISVATEAVLPTVQVESPTSELTNTIEIPTLTPEPPTPVPPTDTPTPSPTPQIIRECVSQPIQDQGLKILMDKFRVGYDLNETYSYHENCDFSKMPPCDESKPIPPEDHEYIQVFWWIIIPRIDNKDTCEIYDGTWLEFSIAGN